MAFGVIVAVAVMVHPLAGTIALALLLGLLAQGFRSIGVGFTIGGGVCAWLVLTHYPNWSWIWPVIVTLGAWTHILGDWMTNSGVPLWWPMVRDGRRWGLVHAPVTFSTGTDVETHVVTPVLIGLLVLSAGLATGLVQVFFTAAVAHAHS